MNRSLWLSTIDAVLVAVALAGLVILQNQPNSSDEQRFFGMLVLPVAYTLASSVFARSNLATAASRAYLMYLCIAISGSGLIAIRLVGELGETVKMPADLQSDRIQSILHSATQLIPQLILPLVCGVGLYALNSVFEKHGNDTWSSTKMAPESMSGLAASLKSMSTPEQIATLLTAIVTSATSLRSECDGLRTVVTGLQQSIQSLAITTSGAGKSFEHMRVNANAMAERLGAMRSETALSEQQVVVIGQSVREMKNILDEFAELASNKIFQDI
jgi:methyl-accepting chemotaxis protein